MSGMMLEAVRLMAIGLGVVFAMLLLFVGLVLSMSALVRRFDRPGPRPAPAAPPADGQPLHDELVAVIAAAIARYRTGRTVDD